MSSKHALEVARRRARVAELAASGLAGFGRTAPTPQRRLRAQASSHFAVRGRPIVFLHGVSQSSLTWNLQMSSSLADAHRLVAMDLRGHGLSDKPHDAYTDFNSWNFFRAAAESSLNFGSRDSCSVFASQPNDNLALEKVRQDPELSAAATRIMRRS